MKLNHNDDKDFAPMDVYLRDHIGRRLRGLYQDVLLEAVPERFMLLLDQLEAREREAGDMSSAPELNS